MSSKTTHGPIEAADEQLVLVVSGGQSSEREISIESGAAVLAALELARERGEWRGAVESAVIATDGAWEWRGERRTESSVFSALGPRTAVFIALHGGRGEDGGLQAALESAQLRYTGSGPAASSLCMDKDAARAALEAAGIAVAPGRLVKALPMNAEERARLEAELLGLVGAQGAWFVKPNQGGSSVGVCCAVSIDELMTAISSGLQGEGEVLVEAALEGVELSVGVIGAADQLRALDPVEIQPRSAGWFDATEKYDEALGAREFCPAVSISEDTNERLRDAAIRAHCATGCSGYSRTDFIVTADEHITALEVNTLPGLTPRSLLPLEAAAEGMSFEALCMEILQLAGSSE